MMCEVTGLTGVTGSRRQIKFNTWRVQGSNSFTVPHDGRLFQLSLLRHQDFREWWYGRQWSMRHGLIGAPTNDDSVDLDIHQNQKV